MTLHTSEGCTVANNSTFSGNLATGNCWINAPGQPNNAGCGIQNQDTRSYGSGLNSIGGGVYATEWTSKAISIWFFHRENIPEDISTGTPDPTSWGAPVARFQGNCNIDEYFKDQRIVRHTSSLATPHVSLANEPTQRSSTPPSAATGLAPSSPLPQRVPLSPPAASNTSGTIQALSQIPTG